MNLNWIQKAELEQRKYQEQVRLYKQEVENEKRLWEEKQERENIPEDFEPAYDSYSRYVWQPKAELEQIIQQNNGLPMESIGNGWFGIHFGGDEWIAILAEDYGRGGIVCEVEFSQLPDDVFETPDEDKNFGKVDSGMLVSRNPIIPAQCISIKWEKDTQEAINDSGFEYDSEWFWQTASTKTNWLQKIAQQGEYFRINARWATDSGPSVL
ncbi:hypothetical protein LCGC14_1357120 [marine sediment metagenome]|uniref:Uncharacterized protein n=1 Tax=marine sediment metagenome TaxID=412755 RepID=A0A0F9MPJ6_9ZZZZ